MRRPGLAALEEMLHLERIHVYRDPRTLVAVDTIQSERVGNSVR